MIIGISLIIVRKEQTAKLPKEKRGSENECFEKFPNQPIHPLQEPNLQNAMEEHFRCWGKSHAHTLKWQLNQHSTKGKK